MTSPAARRRSPRCWRSRSTGNTSQTSLATSRAGIAHRARAADGTDLHLRRGRSNRRDHRRRRRRQTPNQSVADVLRDAIEGDRLIARFQPRLDLVHGRITGVEMIAAWESPLVGPIPRGALSAIAAEHGLSQPLRLALLVRACRQAVDWRRSTPRGSSTSSCHSASPNSNARAGRRCRHRAG